MKTLNLVYPEKSDIKYRKDKIMRRDGKLVIRPDSGNPVDIICGKGFVDNEENIFGGYYEWENEIVGKPKYISEQEHKGVVELLWDIFGGTINDQGYKVLDPHIGAIYGDSINLERQVEIYKRLEAKGFASSNIVLGVGSFTYVMLTRDSAGYAAKGAWFEVKESWEEGEEDTLHTVTNKVAYNIYKDPITDDGTKKSLKGLCGVFEDANGYGLIFVKEELSKEEEDKGLLQTIYEDGKFYNQQTLTEIRNRINN